MLKQKTAIVTGASRGIGAATAKRLAKDGYAVVVNYRESRTLAESVAKLIEAEGGRAVAVQADMARETDIVSLFEATDRAFGPVTALVNNAAINLVDGNGTVEELRRETLDEVWAVNVTGVFLCCREAVKRMRKAGGGAIVNVSSESARGGGTRMTPYGASKGALNTFTVGFAREVAPLNIRVNAVSPGLIDTEAHANATPGRIKALTASIPMNRFGAPEEVAEAITWLLSDAASYISGSVLPINGGR